MSESWPGITGLGHIHPWGLALWTSCPIGSKGFSGITSLTGLVSPLRIGEGSKGVRRWDSKGVAAHPWTWRVWEAGERPPRGPNIEGKKCLRRIRL